MAEKLLCGYCMDREYPSIYHVKKHIRRIHPDRSKIYYTKDMLREKRCLHCHGHFPVTSDARFRNHCR